MQLRQTQRALRVDAAPAAPPVPATSAANAPAPDAAAPPPDRETLLIGMLVRLLSGRELQVARIELDPPATVAIAGTAPAASLVVDMHAETRTVDSESLDVQASGTVVTADGRQLRFTLSVRSAWREERSANFDLQAGQRSKDPLLIVLDGGTATLGARDAAFDIDADGSTERIALATGGSAFVALDRNRNGRIDDGGELFGARSGEGFAELALYDADGNGFIDAGDSVFANLLAWRSDASGQQTLEPLAALGVGALWLGNAAGGFGIRGADGVAVGQVRASGVYLAEDGRAGLLQQVDLIA